MESTIFRDFHLVLLSGDSGPDKSCRHRVGDSDVVAIICTGLLVGDHACLGLNLLGAPCAQTVLELLVRSGSCES